MTKNEFKAWFDGFCEGMEGAPNEKQWERIKARVAEINDVATPYPVFVDRYVTPFKPYWAPGTYWNGTGASGFSTAPTMQDAGRAEYRAALNS